MRMSPRLTFEGFQGPPAVVPRHEHPPPPAAFFLGVACQDKQSLQMLDPYKGMRSGSRPRTSGGPRFLGNCVVAVSVPCQLSKQHGLGDVDSCPQAEQTTAPGPGSLCLSK